MKKNISSILKKSFCSVSLFLFGFFTHVLAQSPVTINSGNGTWVVPCDVTSITVEVWGAGGAGGGTSNDNAKGGGGGGGGAYVKYVNYTVTPGDVISYNIGAGGNGTTTAGAAGGDSWFVNATTFFAKGGAGGAAPNNGGVNGGTGGTANASLVPTGGIKNGGGNGAGGTTSAAGKGGDAGAVGTGGAAAGNGGGNGTSGTPPGGGGGGAFVNNNTNRSGGSGGNGRIIITYTSVLKDYCSKTISSTVEPITNVTFAGINKTTLATINGTPANESFCDQATVQQGGNYPISLKGNTNDGRFWRYTDYYRVYIDWNQNAIFEPSEYYDIGTITSSSGTDAKVLTGSIDVPINAVVGLTRMRVVKNYNSYSDACSTISDGQTEDYVVNVTARPNCSGPPSAGTVTVTPNSGIVGSAYTVAAMGYTVAGNITYQWQSSTNGAAWVNEGTATATYSDLNKVAPNLTIGSTVAWRLVVRCTTSNQSNTSVASTFTISYCNPSSSSNTQYISQVQFLGTLNPDTLQNSGYSPGGYADYKGNAAIAKQIPGEAINVSVNTSAQGGGNQYSSLKAWVDWNRDGVFNDNTGSNEIVYFSGSTQISNMVFGFIVPNGTTPGIYTIRIRNAYNVNSLIPCGNLNNGETEDYSFEIIADCAAKITAVTNGQRCGSGQVTVSVTGNGSAGATSYKWYTTPSGGVPISGVTGTTYSPTLTTTTTFYVTAGTGSCDSVIRTPVTASVNPTPTIVFSTSKPAICGDEASNLLVTSSGDKEMVTVLNETFDSGLGAFENVRNVSGNGNTNSDAYWMNKTSIYIPSNPPYTVLRPAVSSGLFQNKFAVANADVNPGAPTSNALSQKDAIPINNFLNLTLTFRAYAAFEGINPNESLLVQVQQNNGAWTTVHTINSNTGVPNRFDLITVPLNAYINSTSLKVRFLFNAYAANREWAGDIVAVDDIKIFGEKALATSFAWTAPAGVLFNSDCTTPYSGNAETVCIKPTPAMIQSVVSWDITATATLSNGCSASGTITINNNTKTWKPNSETDWSQANQWSPSGLPTSNHCVLIKKPIVLGVATNGLAKNIKIETASGTSGSINVLGSLTVSDEINNTGNASNFTVESDANLIQVNDAAVNVGDILVKRNSTMKRLDYTYWSSPVTNQNIKAFSPGTLNNRFYTYNEITDLFDVISDPSNTTFMPGKGYAIRASNSQPTSSTIWPGVFIGKPNNGPSLSIPLNYTDAAHGYNLIGNPYPSNIDFELLHSQNSSLIYNTAYFWTNVNPNPAMQGSNYPNGGYINNYAIYSGSGGIPATTTVGTSSEVPNQYIKVGQGFIVKAKSAGNLKFSNLVRTNNTTAKFFSKNISSKDKDRYWLQLITPLNVVSTALVAYIEGATNDFELDYDAPLFGIGVDAIFTKLNDQSLGIQGRQFPLNVNDIVSLGVSHYDAGSYTIKISNQEGVFANGQSVYLKDLYENTITNLSKGSYTYQGEKGSFTNRFELLYVNDASLLTQEATKQNVLVYKEGFDFVVESKASKIDEVAIYDMQGRLVKTLKENTNRYRISSESLVQGVYLLRIVQGGAVVTKKIIN